MGGRRLTEAEDNLIFSLSVHHKMSYDTINDKFGYSADAIRAAKERYLKRIQETGAEILDPESNIALIVKARANVMAAVSDPKDPNYWEATKMVLSNIDKSFMGSKVSGGRSRSKSKELPAHKDDTGYLQSAASEGVFKTMDNSVTDEAEEISKGGSGSGG